MILLKKILVFIPFVIMPVNSLGDEALKDNNNNQKKYIDQCADIQADLDRLECFENLFAKDNNKATNADSNEPPLITSVNASESMKSCTLLSKMSERLVCFDTVASDTKQQNTPDSSAMDKAQMAGAEQPSKEAKRDATLSDNNTSNTSLLSKPKTPPSFIMESWQLIAQADRGAFVIMPYKPTYVLPLSYAKRINNEAFSDLLPNKQADNIEIKFQLSFKAKIWPDIFSSKDDLWFAYTQMSYWQAYNQDASAVFRETNYEPELIYSWKSDISFLGINHRLITISLNHQSNGREEPLSRSWNRIIVGAYFDVNEDFSIVTRVWNRINTSAKDNNRDIEEYVGRGELSAYWKRGRNNYSIMLLSSLDDNNRGGVKIDWSHSISFLPVKPYLQYFYGYGDSLIDYNFRSSRISFGLMLTDWF